MDETEQIDAAALARLLRCDQVTVNRYARQRIIQREKNRKFFLAKTIGDVVVYLRQMSSRMGTGDTMKASAALKDAQRRLTETKLARLDGDLLSMPEVEMIWNDLAAAAKWLFLNFPLRARLELGDQIITPEIEKRLKEICASMLGEVALSGAMQLPTGETDVDDDGEDETPAAPDPKPAT